MQRDDEFTMHWIKNLTQLMDFARKLLSNDNHHVMYILKKELSSAVSRWND